MSGALKIGIDRIFEPRSIGRSANHSEHSQRFASCARAARISRPPIGNVHASKGQPDLHHPSTAMLAYCEFDDTGAQHRGSAESKRRSPQPMAAGRPGSAQRITMCDVRATEPSSIRASQMTDARPDPVIPGIGTVDQDDASG